MSPVPFSRRERLTSDVGPGFKGSKPGFACSQMPDKSGADFALSLAPRTAVAITAASARKKTKSPCCKSMGLLLTYSRANLHPLRPHLQGKNSRLWGEC